VLRDLHIEALYHGHGSLDSTVKNKLKRSHEGAEISCTSSDVAA